MAVTPILKLDIDIAKPNAIAASQQNVLWASLGALTNTIANASTAGHQATSFIVQDSLIKNHSHDVFSVSVKGMRRNTSDGAFHVTGNPYDCALTGKGNYFAVQTDRGVRWTRGGQFTLANDGTLRTASTGYQVLDSGNGSISIPQNAKSVKITNSGNIFADDQFVARIGVFNFSTPQDLRSEGHNLLNHDTPPQSAQETSYNVVQGGYEESNVSPAEASLELMKVMRIYDATEKVVKAYGKIHEASLNMKSV